MMNITPVTDKRTERLFLTMPLPLYRNDPNYIRPFDSDIQAVFDPEKNPRYESGECARWLLLNQSGSCIGRIAAFYDGKTIDNDEERIGGCGFFECIDDQEAANMLFDTAKIWLADRGMEAMDGPINFGSRERWWGLLIDGFHAPCYCCNYNPPYYQQLFESYGFEVYFKQFTYRREMADKMSSKIGEKAMHALKDSGYTFAHIDPRQLSKAAEDFRTVYNGAWARHTGVNPIDEKSVHKLMKSLKPVIDPRIIWFAYYHGKPVGFWVSIPDVNQLIVKYMNGRLTLWGNVLFLWNRWRRQCKTIFGIVFGVVPEHQRKGVEAAMVMTASKIVQDSSLMPYKDLQMNWIGDFNPKMINLVRYIGGAIYKTHHTYRYLFDRTKPFERHPIL
ncbi:hypothetical protein [Parapedobacter tibetensis]|uniref:hypothetical protein n=1 Tax=Parapedobacter tibetensis TaxID=2972951 RepID=UPI00214D2460|nr:hypothetical protein [Parapedobacter tibetensis]